MARKEVAMARVQERKMKRPALFIALTSAESIGLFYYISGKAATPQAGGTWKGALKKRRVRLRAPFVSRRYHVLLFREDRVLYDDGVEVAVPEVLVCLEYALRDYLVAQHRGVVGRGEYELVRALGAGAGLYMQPVPAHYALRYLDDLSADLHEMALQGLALVEYLLYGVSLGYLGPLGLLGLLGLRLFGGGGAYGLGARARTAFPCQE